MSSVFICVLLAKAGLSTLKKLTLNWVLIPNSLDLLTYSGPTLSPCSGYGDQCGYVHEGVGCVYLLKILISVILSLFPEVFLPDHLVVLFILGIPRDSFK